MSNMRLPGQGVGPITSHLWCAKCKQMKDRRGGTSVGKSPFLCAECKRPKNESK